jgi:hypothetical protein
VHRRGKGDMSTQPAGVYGDLVAGLLDARDAPAADRFDEELAHAVASGELTAEAARRLKFWQSATVDELAEHVRLVVPATLSALSAARTQAAQRAQQAAPGDTPEPASGTLPPPETSLESRPVRQLVADLVVTRSPAHTTPS